MLNALKRKLNPACYQGITHSSNHFEGWYYKIVTKDEDQVLAVIPGVCLKTDRNDSQAFIQVLDGMRRQSYYFKYPIEDFQSEDGVFNVQIHKNYFSTEEISLDIEQSNVIIKGQLKFRNITPWVKSVVSPGIMGWYSWVPFMECYHGIVSLDHDIEGKLVVNHQVIDFNAGKGYTEKDWGKSFPDAWVWCQSNHFPTRPLCFTGSIAIIPWIHQPFLGFIIGIWHHNELYRFATYTGAKIIQFEISDSKIFWVVKQGNLILEITINRTDGGSLKAPTVDGMAQRIIESLNSTIELKLISVSSSGEKEIILEETGQHAGLEVGGNIPRLLAMAEKCKVSARN